MKTDKKIYRDKVTRYSLNKIILLLIILGSIIFCGIFMNYVLADNIFFVSDCFNVTGN